jgi:hypothetical protein
LPVQPAALELLTALSRVLAHWGRWYVFGALALIAYGVPRLSADVDVTVRLVPDEPGRFVCDMEAAGSSGEGREAADGLLRLQQPAPPVRRRADVAQRTTSRW